jgi:hypothetical protein
MLRTRRSALRVAGVAAVAAAGLLATPAAGAVEDSASYKARSTEWTQSGTGVSINQGNGTYLTVAAVKNSIDGDGAVVANLTLNGSTGTDTATRYQANGVQKFEETLTIGTADANGMIPYNGTGKCTGPGTGVHKNEKCSYTFTGTLNPATQVVDFNITGTTTR